MIAELVAIAQMLVAGIPLARILDRHAETREIGARVGEGFLLGAGVCAAMVVALPWSRGVLIAVLVIAGVSAAVFANRQRAAGGPAGEPPALRASFGKRSTTKRTMTAIAALVAKLPRQPITLESATSPPPPTINAVRYAATRIEFTGPTNSTGVARIVNASTAMSCVAEAIAKIVMMVQNGVPKFSGIAAIAIMQIAIASTAVAIHRR